MNKNISLYWSVLTITVTLIFLCMFCYIIAYLHIIYTQVSSSDDFKCVLYVRNNTDIRLYTLRLYY